MKIGFYDDDLRLTGETEAERGAVVQTPDGTRAVALFDDGRLYVQYVPRKNGCVCASIPSGIGRQQPTIVQLPDVAPGGQTP